MLEPTARNRIADGDDSIRAIPERNSLATVRAQRFCR
jgi:hypothetical protein